MIRTIILSTGSALALVLGSGAANALAADTQVHLEREEVCLLSKFEAISRYHRCVMRAYRQAVVQDSEPLDEIASCDVHFDRDFERAEANGACHTPGGASPVRERIRAEAELTFRNVAAAQPCPSLYTSEKQGTCLPSLTNSVIDLDDMLDQITTTLTYPCK